MDITIFAEGATFRRNGFTVITKLTSDNQILMKFYKESWIDEEKYSLGYWNEAKVIAEHLSDTFMKFTETHSMSEVCDEHGPHISDFTEGSIYVHDQEVHIFTDYEHLEHIADSIDEIEKYSVFKIDFNDVLYYATLAKTPVANIVKAVNIHETGHLF
jgi:hypothetical protein